MREVFRHFCHISGSRSGRVKKANLKLTVAGDSVTVRRKAVGMFDGRKRKAAFSIHVPLSCVPS